MPGVLLLETMKQAAVKLLSAGSPDKPFRLVRANGVKFGKFVKPGSRLKIFVRHTESRGGMHIFDGRIDLLNESLESAGRALAADFTLAPCF